MIKNIAIVYGGYSSEYEISHKSASVVKKHLDKAKYNPYLVRISKEAWYVDDDGKKYAIDKNDFTANMDGKKMRFDGIFNAIHGTPGEDGKLQSYFEMLGIPFTGSDSLGAAITFNKWTCNTIVKQLGYTCANSLIIRDKSKNYKTQIVSEIGLPCFIKPNNGGSSFGVTKVKEENQIEKAIETAFNEGSEVLVEAFVEGTEITCGVIVHKGETRALPITEIISENEFFDYQAKYEGKSKEITPARISDALSDNIKKQSVEIFKALNMKSFARIDYIIKGNIPYLIEINTIPGLSEQSIIPQQSGIEGISLKDLFSGFLEDIF